MQTKDKAKFHIILVQAWVQKGQKFLLAQRSKKELQAPGLWSLPGGKVETNGQTENFILQKNLKKEVREETGVQINNDLQLVFNDCFTRVDGASVVSLTFLCKYKNGIAKPMEDTETVLWLTLKELNEFKQAKPFLKRQIKALEKFVSGGSLK